LTFFISVRFSNKNDNSNIPQQTACEEIQKNFPKRLKTFAWDTARRRPVDSSFYHKYLSTLKEFEKGKIPQQLYFHSVPDINTDMCLVVIESVHSDETTIFTHLQNQHFYYLVDLTKKPHVLLELARFEGTIDSQRRVSSEFTDDTTIVQIDIRERGYRDDNDGIEIDSGFFRYFLNEQGLKSTLGHGKVMRAYH